MPVGKDFWNPYRWVTLSNRDVEHDVPRYHHTFSGLSGRLWCELEALTPLLIGDGQVPNIQFVRHKHNGQPYIPGTSLKGAIRSLVEVVGNGTVPFSVSVEPRHQPGNAKEDTGGVSQLDPITRTFGYLHQSDSNVFAGLIHFSNAEFATSPQPPNQWQESYKVVVGKPQPSHAAFYPGSNKRKFYHHHPGVTELVKAPQNIDQVKNVRPAPPGTRFHFTVDFTNLRDDELNLLLYCLALEEQVTVTLSSKALGKDEAQDSVILEGPLRHKIGGAKPHGAGSVYIRITKMELCKDATARYRGYNTTHTWVEPNLIAELDKHTASLRGRTDQTMQELRAMLIYSTQDPRDPIHYPRYDWFKDERKIPFPKQTRLKPTI